MTPAEIDELARAMYEAPDKPPRPSWDQLGETTKSVWRDYVRAELFGEFA